LFYCRNLAKLKKIIVFGGVVIVTVSHMMSMDIELV